MNTIKNGSEKRPGRQRLLDKLSDLKWHDASALAMLCGIRFGARVHELRRMGYTIETSDDGGVARYRLTSKQRGEAQSKRVRVLLDVSDASDLLRGIVTPSAGDVLRDAIASFDANRERL